MSLPVKHAQTCTGCGQTKRQKFFFAFVLLIAFVLWHSATVIIVAVVIFKPDYALRQRLTKSILVSRFYDIFLVPFSICKTKEIYIKTHSTVRALLLLLVLWGFFVTP